MGVNMQVRDLFRCWGAGPGGARCEGRAGVTGCNTSCPFRSARPIRDSGRYVEQPGR